MQSLNKHFLLINQYFSGEIISWTCFNLACTAKTVAIDPSTHRFHGSDAWCSQWFAAPITVVVNITIMMFIDGMFLLKIESCVINSYE